MKIYFVTNVSATTFSDCPQLTYLVCYPPNLAIGQSLALQFWRTIIIVSQFKTTTFNSKEHKLETKTYLTWFFTCKSYSTAENNLMHWFALNLVFTCKCIMNVFYMFCLLYAKYFKWQLLSRVRTFCSNLSFFKYTILVCSKPNCCAYRGLKNQLAD